MYSDLFDHLGGGRGAGGGGGGGPSSRGGGGASEPESAPPLLSFKAGKIIMEAKENVGPTSNNSPTYTCKADPRRGEIRLVWNENNTTGGGGGGGNNNNNNNSNSAGLYWQWYDRRQKTVVDRIPLSEHKGTTFERVELKDKQHEEDRIYVWTQKGGTGSGGSGGNNDNKKYAMFWMQNADASKDDEIVTKVNEYLADPNSAAPAGSGGATAMDTSSDGTTTAGGAVSGNNNPQQSQVDALSSILENLGMPAAANAASGGSTTAGGGTTSGSGGGGNGNAGGGGTDADADGAAGSAAPRPAGGTLTLADLQGAMVGIQQEQMQAASGVLPLEEVVTPDAVSGLLEDDAARARLMELLPPDQRNLEQLRDNLRCPQVQQTLRTLTLALLPDDAGNMDGFYSVLANFQLDPADGQAAMVGAGAGGTGNGDPIRAFFDCILAAAEREKRREEEKEKEEKKDAAEEGKAGGEEDKPKKEEGGEGGGGGDEGKEKEKDDEEAKEG